MVDSSFTEIHLYIITIHFYSWPPDILSIIFSITYNITQTCSDSDFVFSLGASTQLEIISQNNWRSRAWATSSSGDHQPIQPEYPGNNGERLKAADKDDIHEEDDSDLTQTLAGLIATN